MSDRKLPHFFALGHNAVLGPLPAGEVAEVIRRASGYTTQLGAAPIPNRLLELADFLHGLYVASVTGSAEVPFSRNGLPSVHATIIDPVSAAEAAEILGCTASNVRQRIRRCTLPAERIRGRWVIDRGYLQRGSGYADEE